MTEPTTPPPDHVDESTGAGASPSTSGSKVNAPAESVIDSIRDAVEDLAERAAPTVRELSAKAAEFAAVAADRAAPLVRKAGEATADASGRLAEKSRTWAADLRESMGGDAPVAPAAGAAPTESPDPAVDAPPTDPAPDPAERS